MKSVYFDSFSISEQANNKELLFHDSLNNLSYNVDCPFFLVKKEFGSYYIFCFFTDGKDKSVKLVYNKHFPNEAEAESFIDYIHSINDKIYNFFG